MKSSDHQLAAIVFTDIAGYTSTTQVDEQKALIQVQRHEKAVNNCAKEYGGTVLNYYGDGSLSTFSSVTNAIEAAGKIQQKMTESPVVPLRIGIHLGEIYFKDGNYLGDGINIASRIQSEAEAGQILVSEAVFQAAKNKPNFEFEEIGTRQLKNVDHPVKIHRVEVTSYSSRTHQSSRPSTKWIKWIGAILILGMLTFLVIKQLGDRVAKNDQNYSILILPFEDQSPNIEQTSFGLGIADEIHSKLSGIHNLNVRSRSSAKFLKDKNWSAKEIADKLDVTHILEGSFRQQENLINLNLSLIDAQHDQLIQPINYQGELRQDFINVQNEIARTVIDLLKIKLIPAEQSKLAKVATDNLEAYKFYLMGKSYLLKGSLPEYLMKSADHFQKAIQEDSSLAQAYAGLAELQMMGAGFGYKSVAKALEKAKPIAEKAYKLDSTLAETNQVMGTIYLNSNNIVLAERKLQKAIEIDPSNEWPYMYLGLIHNMMGNFDLAQDYGKIALSINPFSPTMKANFVFFYAGADLYDKAITLADSFLIDYPQSNILLWAKGLALTMQGELDAAIQTFMSRSADTLHVNWVLGYAYGLKGDTLNAQKVLNYLLEKYEHTYLSPSQIACVYLGMGNMEKVYEWFLIEDSYYFKLFPMFKELRNDPNVEDAFTFLKPFLD